MWKWLIGLFLVLALGCVGSGYWLSASGKLRELQEQFNPGMKPVTVRVAEVRRGNLVRTISAPGTIMPRTKVDISAQVAARVVQLPFREGQRVQKGDVLVRLDADDLAAALDSAKARKRSAEAALDGLRAGMENADREMRRRKELLESKDMSPAQFDEAKTAYDRSKSAYEQGLREIEIAEANIRRAEKDLGNTTITSPIDGIVSNRVAEVGELVMVGTLNNPGSVIMQVADLSDMLMKARVDEANIAPVQPGQKCRITINAFAGRSFTGEVERIRPTKQTDRDGTTYFETEIRVDLPKDNVLSGMIANVDIEVETFRDVLKIPTQSVIDRPLDELPNSVLQESTVIDRSKKYVRLVYVYDNGKVKTTPVAIGPSDLTDTVVLQGLTEGTKIVSGPFKALNNLKEDSRVTTEEPAKKDGGKPPAKDTESHEEPAEPDSPST